VLHVSSRYPARHGCLAVVVPLAQHPTQKNGVVVYDLRHDPTPLLSLDADAVRRLVYTATEDLAEGESRIPLKVVHLNKCPVLAPLATLTAEAAERWAIDLEQSRRHREALLAARDLPAKLAQVFGENPYGPASDPDFSLYDGLISDEDRRRCEQVRRTPPERLAHLDARFTDPRLGELYFRYRARNWPQTLSVLERARWDAWRRAGCGIRRAADARRVPEAGGAARDRRDADGGAARGGQRAGRLADGDRVVVKVGGSPSAKSHRG